MQGKKRKQPPTTARARARRTSRGRQKIDIRLMENKKNLQSTFSKRRDRFFRKAFQLSELCGAHLAVLVFSPAGRAYCFGEPSVEHVLRRYLPRAGEDDAPPVLGAAAHAHACVAGPASLRAVEEAEALVAVEEARMAAVAEKVVQAKAGRRFWWEADVEELAEAELPEFVRALQRLRDNVSRRADALHSANAQSG